jgi:hypothetical protein
MGALAVGLMVFGPLGAALTAYYESPAPLVVLLIFGGAIVMPALPGPAVQLGVLILLIALTAGLAVIARRIRTP